ncbi:unnamed protein product [Kluyveromyces dobzhanskii CBS 2104]|uniref:WGS project CCBQ000000000 data, contig 00107 n=1 Tax=Kluyveromyces dobzhanskii CBS 2104 TaxID=1427455 RepID=A0A0A8L0M1_9SACH|nr:unnamed protein product [Kluyveromyces dobzhanskii CBS 2104]
MYSKENSSVSATTTPKKRGRPAILKQYSDPMKSPMAQSSLQMQKSQQTFNKPLMRVGNSPTKFKTPQRKRRSSGADYSPPHSAKGSTKKGRYRGVVMNSPFSADLKSNRPKSNRDDEFSTSRTDDESADMDDSGDFDDHDSHSLNKSLSSAPGTPLDHVFSSISRAHNVKSSPPVMFDSDSPIQAKRNLAVAMNETPQLNAEETMSEKRWKFMLNVGRNGKACIETNSVQIAEGSENGGSIANALEPPKHLLETPIKVANVDENGVAKFDKKRVMGFLRQMKSKNKTLDDKPLPEQSRKFTIPSSPAGPPNSTGTIAEPLTPKCSQLMQLKTGFTPNLNIDELLVSPKLQESLNKNLFKSPNQYVFKVLSGDPLLINDHQESDIMNSHCQEVSDILSFLNSPKRVANLSTPPSHIVNFNSPRSNSRTFASNLNNAKLQLPSLSTPKADSQQYQVQHTLLPSTPLLKLVSSGTPSQFTPIIQKQMNDESKFTLTNSIHPINLRKSQGKKLEANDDARMALKKLINGN